MCVCVRVCVYVCVCMYVCVCVVCVCVCVRISTLLCSLPHTVCCGPVGGGGGGEYVSVYQQCLVVVG